MPEIALIGVGKDNSFGHPSDGTIERLNKIKCKILRTDENGEIELFVNKFQFIDYLTIIIFIIFVFLTYCKKKVTAERKTSLR